MRMPGLLLVPLAMVAFASAGQARPSAPSTAADDVRELGKSIEQIHPDPFRSVSRQRFESEVSALARRAPALSQDELHRSENELQKLTDEQIKEIDKMGEEKEQEVLTV